MDLTGQLCNLPEHVRSLFNLRLERRSGQPHGAASVFLTPRFVAVRSAIVSVLAEEAGGLRLRELRQRVEQRLGEDIDAARFKDYVNDQSHGKEAILERLGYGHYKLACD
jgi:hypothetical protein